MSRKHRKVYKRGKADGYDLGYAQGLHDGNPLVLVGEAIADVVNRTCEILRNALDEPDVKMAIEEVLAEGDVMYKWVPVRTDEYDGRIVHEVACPNCGHRETFHDKPSSSCYVCGTELIYAKEEENE